MNKLAVIAVATETETAADFERVTVGASIEQVEGEDLVGGGEGLLTDLVACVARLYGIVTGARGVVRVEGGSREQR